MRENLSMCAHHVGEIVIKSSLVESLQAFRVGTLEQK